MAPESLNPSDAFADTANREIVISRVLDAPRELVFQAWTNPEHVVKWWGPTGFKTTSHGMEVRTGGVWRFTMHGPDGTDYPNRIVFNEVVEPERLAYTHDDGGESNIGPISFETTVIFEQYGPDASRTKLTMRSVFSSAEERERISREYGAVEGGLQHVGRLAEHLAEATGNASRTLTLALPSDREVILQRTFNAPRWLVFEAFSKPEHVRHWWGCRQFTVPVCKMDFRPGGVWRIVQRTPEGHEHPFKGEYKEIVAPERIVQTFIYDVEGIRDHPAIETYVFAEEGGKTVLTNTMLHDSQQSRDGHLSAGMEGGAAESLDRLAGLVESMVESGVPA